MENFSTPGRRGGPFTQASFAILSMPELICAFVAVVRKVLVNPGADGSHPCPTDVDLLHSRFLRGGEYRNACPALSSRSFFF
jgi:hypothetical protein